MRAFFRENMGHVLFYMDEIDSFISQLTSIYYEAGCINQS